LKPRRKRALVRFRLVVVGTRRRRERISILRNPTRKQTALITHSHAHIPAYLPVCLSALLLAATRGETKQLYLSTYITLRTAGRMHLQTQTSHLTPHHITTATATTITIYHSRHLTCISNITAHIPAIHSWEQPPFSAMPTYHRFFSSDPASVASYQALYCTYGHEFT
jgi:hypothetical protein